MSIDYINYRWWRCTFLHIRDLCRKILYTPNWVQSSINTYMWIENHIHKIVEWMLYTFYLHQIKYFFLYRKLKSFSSFRCRIANKTCIFFLFFFKQKKTSQYFYSGKNSLSQQSLFHEGIDVYNSWIKINIFFYQNRNFNYIRF